MFATTPAGKLEFASYFSQEFADLKAFDVDSAAFRNISLAFNKIVSTLRLVKEGLDVNIPDFGKGLLHFLFVCDTTRNA